MIEKMSSSDLEALLLRKRAEEVLKKQQEEEAARLKLQEDEAARQVGKLKVTIFNPCLGKGSKKKKKLEFSRFGLTHPPHPCNREKSGKKLCF